MPGREAADFDQSVEEIIRPYATDGLLSMTVVAKLNLGPHHRSLAIRLDPASALEPGSVVEPHGADPAQDAADDHYHDANDDADWSRSC